MRFIRENGWKRNSVILMLIALATLLSAIAPQDRVFADDGELAAVYRNGSFEVVVPNNQGVTSNHASKVTIPLDRSVALEDLAWDRLKVNAGDSSRIVSISEILRVPTVRIFAQRAYAAGSTASVRIITADSKAGNPLRDSRVKLELLDGDHSTTLFTGRTDSMGTAQIAFALPAVSFGSRQLRVTADTLLGSVTANQPIQLERRDRSLLTTDKPLYQPGQ